MTRQTATPHDGSNNKPGHNEGEPIAAPIHLVMPALVAGIHVFLHAGSRPWMAGTTPGHDEANSARPSGNKPGHVGLNNKRG
jgi:hypothetical protein